MTQPMNTEIARKCFASLVLDYEYPGDERLGFEPFASGRVLVDGWWTADLVAKTRDELVAKFENTSWR